MQDHELAKRILAHEEKAKEAFYSIHRDRIFKASAYFLGHQDAEIEDVVQETFLIGLRQMSGYDPKRASLYTWLAHICVNLCYARIRLRKRMVAAQEAELEAMLGAAARQRGNDREAADERKQLVSLVRQKRRELGDKCRKVLELRDEDEKSYAELADILRIPMGTVTSRLARCRDELKRRVEAALAGG